jgi:uncharacterized protein (TIGR03067 family)
MRKKMFALMLWAKTKIAVIITCAIVLAGGGNSIDVRAALGSQAAASAESEQALQGTWVGQDVSRPQGEYRLTVSGNSIKFQEARAEEWYEATITLRPKANPKRAALLIERCSAPQYVNKTANFIYKIEGKTLTLAGSEPGSEKEPTAFEPNPDNPLRIFVLNKTPESDEALEAYSAKQLSKIAARSKEFKIEKPYGETYDTVLKCVKENVKLADTSFLIPHEAEVADKETGQISTTLGVSRSWDHLRNAPQRWLRRLIITLIKDGDSATTVKVAITQRKRHYQRVLLYGGRVLDEIPTGSWGNPKVSNDESKKWADRIKAALQ